MVSSLFGLVLIGFEPTLEINIEDQTVQASPKDKGKGKKKGGSQNKGGAKKSGSQKSTGKKNSSQPKSSSSKPKSTKPKPKPSSDRNVPPPAEQLQAPPSSSQRVEAPASISGNDQSKRPPYARKPSQSSENATSIGRPQQRQGAGALPRKPHEQSDWVVVKPAWTPEGWNPKVHQTRPSSDPQWSPNNWGRGYFVFSPPPKGETVQVVEKDMSGARVSSSSCSRVTRDIDRRGSLKIGARASSYVSSYESGFESAYADLGAGGVIGYRLLEPIGLEVGYSQYAPEMDFESSVRSNSTVQASAQLYLFPWTRVSPYLSGGYTLDRFDVNDQQVDAEGVASGPHGGLGVEWALGQHLAFGLESRYILYKNMDANDQLRDNALQVFGGLDIYF